MDGIFVIVVGSVEETGSKVSNQSAFAKLFSERGSSLYIDVCWMVWFLKVTRLSLLIAFKKGSQSHIRFVIKNKTKIYKRQPVC